MAHGKDKIIAIDEEGIITLDVNTGKREKVLDDKKIIIMAQSPDGNKIAAAGGTNAYIYYIAEKKSEILAKNNKISSFSWNPDGVRIAYVNQSTRYIEIFNTRERKKEKELYGRYPHWSPNGEKLAVYDFAERAICIVRDDGTNRYKAIENVGAGYAWFPDGKTLCCVRGKELLAVDIENTTFNQIGDFNNTGSYLQYKAFSISPDGSKVAYTYSTFPIEYEHSAGSPWPQLDTDIYVYHMKTKDTSNITNTPNQWEISPKWSKDGKKIYCGIVSGIKDRNPVPAIIEME